MINTWIAATAVAVIAGVTGFFAVLRGSTFAAHAIPNGAFAGAAGASLLGLNPFAGLAVFSLAGALGIAGLSRRARNDVATALTFVLMLGIGALFVSWSSGYAQEAYSLLFGEVFGVSADQVLPILILGAVSVAAGDRVQPGQLVGRVGSTGNSTGPHLHFEVRRDGRAIDPTHLLSLNSSIGRTNR